MTTRTTLLRILLFVCSVAAAYPVRSYAVTAGTDASWAFALNYAHDRGLIFGRDAIFTYGPFAWLSLPMDVGINLWPSLAFQTGCWLAFAGLLAWFVFARKLAIWRVAAFTACLMAGWRSFHHWDYVGPEMFLAFAALLLIGAAAQEGRWLPFFAASWFLGLVLLFTKFSAGIMVLSADVLFSAVLSFIDSRRAMRLAIAGLLGTSAFLIPSLLYFSSPAVLWRYIRAGLEFSSGYSAAMSTPGTVVPVAMGLALIGSWLILTVALWRCHDRAFPLAVAFFGPWFLLFKHSFVRESFHAGFIFAFAPLLWAIVVLFSEAGRQELPRLAPALAIFLAVMGLSVAPPSIPTRAPLSVDRLPEPLLRAIGSDPVAIFPNENAYAAANALNYRPFPVLQAYSAYTPYLDQADAAFLETEATAPRLVLFDWQPTDDRNPLMDVPATTLSLYRHYDLAASEGGHLLLRRRNAPRFGAPRLLQECDWQWDRPLAIPSGGSPLIARITLEKNAPGSLENLFFRLPAITLQGFRVPPEVIQDGVPLNFLPANLEEARALFAGQQVPIHATELTLGGPGTPAFRGHVQVEILQLPDAGIHSD